MKDNDLIEIIQLCLALDKQAGDIYLVLDDITQDETLKKFWRDLAEDEKKHIAYWEKLLDIATKRELPNIFDDVRKVKEELVRRKSKIDIISKDIQRISKTATLLLLAYKLEFYLLHPAFAALFHLMKNYTGDRSPEDDYEEHINKLIEALRSLDQATPEFELFGEFARQMWADNLKMAGQIGRIKTLGDLIPVCTHCKKIINYKGYWEEVEYYIKKMPDASFTHWTCPECIKKIYPQN
jgi:hypothetical protein